MLEEQHRGDRRSLSTRSTMRTRERKRLSCFTDLADKLTVHATIEERHFYPAVRGSGTDEIVFESVEEHQVMKADPERSPRPRTGRRHLRAQARAVARGGRPVTSNARRPISSRRCAVSSTRTIWKRSFRAGDEHDAGGAAASRPGPPRGAAARPPPRQPRFGGGPGAAFAEDRDQRPPGQQAARRHTQPQRIDRVIERDAGWGQPARARRWPPRPPTRAARRAGYRTAARAATGGTPEASRSMAGLGQARTWMIRSPCPVADARAGRGRRRKCRRPSQRRITERARGRLPTMPPVDVACRHPAGAMCRALPRRRLPPPPGGALPHRRRRRGCSSRRCQIGRGARPG